MKQRTLKKMTSIAFALIFVLSAVLTVTFPDVAMAATDFVLTQVCTNTPLTRRETFKITISMKNISGGGAITDISLDFSSATDIAILTNGGTIADVDPATSIADGDTVALGEFDMRFVGDGSSGLMPVKVNYSKGGAPQPEATANLYLDVEQPSTPAPTPPPGLYKPNLTVSIPDNTSVTAGAYTSAKFTIKNISTSTSASNIVVVPEFGESTPFTNVKVLTAMPISQLYTNGTAEVTLSILADKYAAAGTYPFKIKLSCKNALGEEYPTEHTVYINIINNNKDTKLTLQTSTADNISAQAGKEFTMPVYLVNSGNFYAKDITVTLTGLSQDTFTLQYGAGRFIFDRVDGLGKQKFEVRLNASESLRTGSHPVSFRVEYTTEAGDKVSEEQQIWVPVTGSGDSVSSLEVLEIKPSKATVSSQDVFDVTVKVKNSGSAKTGQIKVSADGTAALLPVTQNLFIVPSMEPGEIKTLTFRFQVSPDAQRGSVPIVVRVEPTGGSGQSPAISQAVSVFVDADQSAMDPNKDIPKIIVGSYSYEPQLVKAGENFTLKVSFINTHSSKTIRNIKGNFTITETSANQTGNVFTPVGSSNTFYIDEIDPKQTYEWSIVLYTIPDALSKTYTVTLSFDYEDMQGNPFKESEIIGIPVYQPSRLEVSEIMIPGDGFMGQPIYMPFNIYNMGKTTVYNVKMSIGGDFIAEPSSQYFGNFDPGYQEYVEINLIPMMPGPATGKVVIEYETMSGEFQTYEKEFSMNVMDMPQMDPGFPVDGGKFPMEPGMNGEPVKEGGFIGSPLFFIIIGVVVVGVTVVIILVVKKRKKDKEFEF